MDSHRHGVLISVLLAACGGRGDTDGGAACPAPCLGERFAAAPVAFPLPPSTGTPFVTVSAPADCAAGVPGFSLMDLTGDAAPTW